MTTNPLPLFAVVSYNWNEPSFADVAELADALDSGSARLFFCKRLKLPDLR